MVRRSLRWLLTPIVRWAWADPFGRIDIYRCDCDLETVLIDMQVGPLKHCADFTSTEARILGRALFDAAYDADELIPVFPENDDQ